MKMPGFTAETSLCRSNRSYRTTVCSSLSRREIQLMSNGILEKIGRGWAWGLPESFWCDRNNRDCKRLCELGLDRLRGYYRSIQDCLSSCDRRYNCGSDKVCIRGSCCPKSRACGDRCCGWYDTCLRPGLCCPNDRRCGKNCCSAPGRCTHDGCCPENQVVCSNRCCGLGESCTGDGCCRSDQICGDRCCQPGESCTSHGCCPPGICCKSSSCPSGEYCCGHQICCPSGWGCKLVPGTTEYGCYR